MLAIVNGLLSIYCTKLKTDCNIQECPPTGLTMTEWCAAAAQVVRLESI